MPWAPHWLRIIGSQRDGDFISVVHRGQCPKAQCSAGRRKEGWKADLEGPVEEIQNKMHVNS